MSDSDKSLLKSAFDAVDDVIKSKVEDENYRLVMLGIEFDENGMPESRGLRCNGSPAIVLAAVTLLINMLEDLEQETLEKINNLGEISERYNELLSKLGLKGATDPAKLDDFIDSLPDDDKIKKLLKEFKRKFGK
jgi:hypothetical protein